MSRADLASCSRRHRAGEAQRPRLVAIAHSSHIPHVALAFRGSWPGRGTRGSGRRRPSARGGTGAVRPPGETRTHRRATPCGLAQQESPPFPLRGERSERAGRMSIKRALSLPQPPKNRVGRIPSQGDHRRRPEGNLQRRNKESDDKGTVLRGFAAAVTKRIGG